MIHNLFRTMCIEHRLLDVHYFLDEATEYEVATIATMLDYVDRPIWERARMQMYVQAQSMSTKALKPEDIIKFKWDQGRDNIEVTNEQKAALAAREEEFRAVLNRRKQKKNIDNNLTNGEVSQI